jgi:hypothetical protein
MSIKAKQHLEQRLMLEDEKRKSSEQKIPCNK